MKYRRIIAAILVAATLFTGATALAAGTAADPLVTKSYLETVFSTPLKEYINTAVLGVQASLQSKIDGLQTAADDYARKQVAAVYADNLSEAVLQRVQELMAGTTQTTLTAGMTQRTLKKGDQITGPAGASFMFVSGMGKLIGPSGSDIINITAGSTRKPGAEIRTGILYMITADNGSGIEITSDTAVVLVKDGARAGYEAQYLNYARALEVLGIFRGSDKGFELERAPSRVEALIMLIRLLGEETDAQMGDAVSPFNDLNIWEGGKYYIAYAYRMRYTNGTSPTTFSPNLTNTLEQYLTFVLRALGYQDGVDFTWNTTSRDLAVQLGLLEQAELSAIDRDGFKRDHVALISFRALACQLKDGSGMLVNRLISDGIITWEQVEAASSLIG